MNRQKDQDRQTASLSISNEDTESPNKRLPREQPSPDTSIRDKEPCSLFASSYIGNNPRNGLRPELSECEPLDPAIVQLLVAAQAAPRYSRELLESCLGTRRSIQGFLRRTCPSLEYLYRTWKATRSIPAVTRSLLLCMHAGFRRVFWRSYYCLKIDISNKESTP